MVIAVYVKQRAFSVRRYRDKRGDERNCHSRQTSKQAALLSIPNDAASQCEYLVRHG
jgi:hypothetical protein